MRPAEEIAMRIGSMLRVAHATASLEADRRAVWREACLACVQSLLTRSNALWRDEPILSVALSREAAALEQLAEKGPPNDA